MFDRLKEDIQSVKDRDPAATSTIQILLLYPGLRPSECIEELTGVGTTI